MPIDDDYVYDPVLLGFVIDVGWPNINTVKLQIVESIRRMESDERAYTYSPELLSIPRWPGQSVADVANFHDIPKFNMADGIKQTIILFAQEDFTFDKYLFVVTNRYTEDQAYRVTRAMSWNAKEDCNCKVYFLAIGNPNDQLETLCNKEQCGYLHVPRPDELQDAITTIYRTQEMPFFVKNYQRLDVYSLKKTFLSERDPEDGREPCCEDPPDADLAFLTLKREHYCPISWGIREGHKVGEQHRHGNKKQSIPDSPGG